MSNYERINDLVYILSDDVRLVLSVVLASRQKGNSNIKYPYHQEFEYTKYDEQVITIKREATSTLNFKSYTFNNVFDDVVLGAQHFERFYDVLDQCKNWFNGSWPVFCKKNGKLYIQKDNPLAQPKVVGELFNNKWISFEPIVILEDNDMSSPGIRFVFNNKFKSDVTVDRYYGLLHVLKGFNMYMATSMLLNYVNTCTPGTNLTQFSTGNNKYPDGNVTGVNGRKPDFYNKKSFFDDK